MFPIGVASLPLYLLLERIGLLDNQFGVAIPETASIFAFTALAMVPALAVFVLAERQLVGGVAGAVKG